MAERFTRPPDYDKILWRTNPGGNPVNAPLAAKRADGFVFEGVPPSDEENWRYQLYGDDLEYLTNSMTRQWRDLYEGIAAGLLNDVFRIVPPLGTPSTMYARYTEKWNVAGTAATGGNPAQIRTDGQQIYYIAGAIAQSLIAAEPADGSEIWESSAVSQFATVATDGAAVYAMSQLIGEPGLFVLGRADGLQDANAGTEYNCDLLVTNGVYVVGVDGTVAGAGSVTFWTVSGPSQTGVVVPLAASIDGLAIDSDTVYVAGTRNVDDVFAYTLSTRALLWNVKLDANDPSPINAIAADGEFIYVGCDTFAIAAGGNRSLFCLNRTTGAIAWSIDFFDVNDLAVDDQYLHVLTAGGTLYLFRKDAPEQGPIATLADVNGIDCDGISVVCADLTTPANFQRNMLGLPAKEFMIAEGTDPNRRPFFNLAVPV